MAYKYRYLHELLTSRPSQFQAVLITGPRRSGKSTLARKLVAEWGGGDVLQFDTPTDQARFAKDPEGILRSLKPPVVLDEVQNVPLVFNYLKKIIDESPGSGCQYILTGSQQFQMMHNVSESLAGRVLVKELLPFCIGEAKEHSSSVLKHNLSALLKQDAQFTAPPLLLTREDVLDQIITGGFPQAHECSNSSEREDWFDSYLQTYVQRDIRALSNVQDLAQFSRFVHVVAARSGSIINYSEIGKDIGVSYKTAQHYLSLLGTFCLWRAIPPYYVASSEKRIIKSPKGILLDSGLACYLTGLNRKGLEKNPLFGFIFESFVCAELLKLSCAFGIRVELTHFRVSNSAEVDLVIEHAGRVVPIEIKSSGTIRSDWGKGIGRLKQIVGLKSDHPSYVMSLHPHVEQLGHGVVHVPLQYFL
jgi:uncharacterized protein